MGNANVVECHPMKPRTLALGCLGNRESKVWFVAVGDASNRNHGVGAFSAPGFHFRSRQYSNPHVRLS
jgi:hypothetical protein